MAWKVKKGINVKLDDKHYVGGDAIPCTDEQAAQMPHAVEAHEEAAMVVFDVDPEAEAMVPKPKAFSKRAK